MFRVFIIGLGLITLLIACGSNSERGKPYPNTVTSEPKASNTGTITLSTIMTDEGVECPAVRGADGELYTIPDMPEAFSVGDKLNIEVPDPMKAMVSFCQQGQTIVWKRIELISPHGKVLNDWDK